MRILDYVYSYTVDLRSTVASWQSWLECMIAGVLYHEVASSNPAGSGGSKIGKIRILHGTLSFYTKYYMYILTSTKNSVLNNDTKLSGKFLKNSQNIAFFHWVNLRKNRNDRMHTSISLLKRKWLRTWFLDSKGIMSL